MSKTPEASDENQLPHRWVVLSCLVLIVTGCGPKLPAPEEPAPLAISRFVGASEFQENSELWSPVRTNQPIVVGLRLRTGADSFIDMKSTSKVHRILLTPNSETTLKQWDVVKNTSG